MKLLHFLGLPLLATALPSSSQHHLAAGPGHEDVIDLSKYTIGQILHYTLEGKDHGHSPLHKLAWVVNRTEEIKDLLNNPDISITLFAPDDEALKFPGHDDHDHDHDGDHHHGPPHRGPPGHDDIDEMDEDAQVHEMMIRKHPFKRMLKHQNREHVMKDKDHDHEHDKERREFIKKLVTAILRYHIVPHKLSLDEIKDASTLPTNLTQVKDADAPFRIRVGTKFELLPPPPHYSVNLNFYAKTRPGPAVLAKNGIIHLIGAPLLPPLTPLDQLFLFANAFATLTSSIQSTELDEHIAPYLHHHDDKKSDFAGLLGLGEHQTNSAVVSVLEELVEEVKTMLPSKDTYKDFPFTIFAPTNLAFAKIPFRIRLFLFSPFGRPILKKLLAFHVVPQYVLHSDYQLNATRSSKSEASPVAEYTTTTNWCSLDVEPTSLGFPMPQFPPRSDRRACPDKDTKVSKFHLPTLLGNEKNQTLAVNVYEYREGFGKGPLTRKISVGNLEQDEKDHVQVFVADGVAWGGAVHVINSIIRPIMPEHHDHDHHHDGHHHGPPGHHEPRGMMKYFNELL